MSREPFSMVPRLLYESRVVPEGETGSDAMAAYLYGFLDLRQGKGNRPTRGYRYVAKMLGWQERTVARYARLLSALGLIELHEGGPNTAPVSASMLVIHNPSREVLNPSCSLNNGTSKEGTRHRHEPLPAPSFARSERRPLPRLTQEDEATPVAFGAGPARAKRATPSRETRHPVSTPVAPNAAGPRSKRYGEVGLREDSRERGESASRPPSEVFALAGLREAFGPVEVIDQTFDPCACCGAPADGQPRAGGTPMCKGHAPF
jgi:hypothetical protein